ncbi:MAG: glycerate kinase [Verrucomicrobiales bacterium]|nr:glycerate kinase [Verrucomicrobiales bacterium]
MKSSPLPNHPLQVLVVPDKFKGTLGAADVARAIAAGWRKARPQDHLNLVPMSDGGDGFGPVVGTLIGARARSLPTTDAAGRLRRARWWWEPSRRIAVIETAQSNGLALLPKGRFHPFDLDTSGVGRLLRAAHRAGAVTGLLGVGGSATNDGGFGLALALGWKFLDRKGRLLLRWRDLERLSHVEPPTPTGSHVRWIVATDVSNPLLGRQGATRVYGPQKGLRPADLPKAEACLAQLAKVMKRQTGFDSRLPGCGAAGGLGYGLQAFLGAERRLGFDVFAEFADLDRRLAESDLVISGEGAVDAQTLMGKGVGQLLAACRRHDKPVALFGGRVELSGRTPNGLALIASLVDLAGEKEAMRRPAPLLRLAAESAAAQISQHYFQRP